MKTTIDIAGRIVVPKPIREVLGLSGGEELDIVEEDGDIRISLPVTKMTLVETDTGLSAVPERELPPLTDEMVREALERIRR